MLLPCVPATLLAQTSASPNTASQDASVVVVLDNSKAGRKSFRDMRLAVNTFLRSMSEDDEVALVSASDRPVLVQDFTGDETLLQKKLPKLKAEGELSLVDAVSFAAQKAAQDANNDNVAVVVFASGADQQLRDVRAVRKDKNSGKPVPVYVIASPKSDWKAQQELQQLATLTGGAAFFPSSRSELREMTKDTAVRVAGPPPGKKKDERAGSTKGLLRNYSTVLVRDIPVIENDTTVEAEGGENILLQEVLVARLRKAELFQNVVDAKEMPASATAQSAQSNGTAELLASILEYRRGNRAQRQLLGWKGGAKFKVRVIMVDAATRQPILSFVEEGSNSSGLLGGTQEHVQAKAMLDVANEIVKQLKRATK
jgi:hypothetical protein